MGVEEQQTEASEGSMGVLTNPNFQALLLGKPGCAREWMSGSSVESCCLLLPSIAAPGSRCASTGTWDGVSGHCQHPLESLLPEPFQGLGLFMHHMLNNVALLI